MIKENSLSFKDKKKANTVIINAITNLMTTGRDDEDLTKYTKCFKVARDLCNEKYGGIFKIPTLAQKESTWGSDEETSYTTAYDSFLSILYLKNMDQVHSSRRWQKTLSQVGRMSTQSTLRIHSIFCPSTSMIKLIMISKRSNEMIMTKVACHQRMKIIQPPGMYPI